mmetsp:Transcript_5299/g.4494  ORF Transcript_5299/g.4494 Transcript_5299/m.4494 type:complete len:91 (+) Transcript_5299:1244-1516(+)
MPKSIGQVHDLLLKTQLQRGEEELTKIKRVETFIMNKAGLLQPVDLMITMYPSLEEGLMFWGMIRPSHRKHEYIIVSSSGIIDGATERIS